MSRFAVPAFLSAGVLLLSSCPGGEEPEPEPTPGPSLGADPAEPAPEGQARAGVIRAGAAGEAGIQGGVAAEAQPGDVVLHNARVRFVIQGDRPGHGYVQTRGGIVDVDLVRTPGVLGRDTVDDIFQAFGVGHLFDAERVEVVSDGTDGGPAVVRATGRDVRWTFIEGAVETSEPVIPAPELDIVTEYTLEPDSWSLRVRTTFANDSGFDARFNPTDGFIASDEELLPWVSGWGLRSGDVDEFDAVGSVGRNGEVAFGLWKPGAALRSLGLEEIVSSAGLNVISDGWRDLLAGDSQTLERYWTVAPDTATIEAERLRVAGASLGVVEGRVTDSASGEGIPGARVHFVGAAGPDGGDAGFALTGPDGRYRAELPPGSYDAWAVALGRGEYVDVPAEAGRYAPYAPAGVNQRVLDVLSGGAAEPVPAPRGRPVPEPVAVTVGEEPATADFALLPPARVRVDVRDGAGAPLPGYVSVVALAPEGDALPDGLRAAFAVPGSGAETRAWTHDGSIDLDLLPGRYRVQVDHSWRHGRFVSEEIAVGSAESVVVTAELPEVVAKDGWLAMDSHLHAAPSPDGSLPMEDRLIACAATGVDLPVTTDHDSMSDYRPLASALGLDGRLRVIPGSEVSPVIRGHFNLFPVEPDAAQPSGGAVPWWIIPEDTQELMDRMHARGGPGSMVQVNHPRDGMFNFAGYRPETGAPDQPDRWSWDFDAFELINGTGARNWEDLRPDWFSFLDAGRLRTPTGVSDSHSRTSPCGYGRTDVFLDTEDPASVTHEALVEALRAGHVVVAGGLTLRAGITTGDTALPGDEVDASGVDEVTVDITLRSPDWLVPDVVRVYRNGVVVAEEAVHGEPGAGGLRAELSVRVDATSDAWVVVEAEGSAAAGGPWRGGLPYAVTNAFLVDGDGGGWTAPGN